MRIAWLATLGALLALPQAANAYQFEVDASPAPGTLLQFTDTGGGLAASTPVSISGSAFTGAGTLDIAFTYAPGTVRTYYPGPDPLVKGFPILDGATLVGTLASIDIVLRSGGLDVLRIHNDNPTTPFGVVKYQTFHSDGRGTVFPADYGAAVQNRAYLQGGYCHLAYCLHNSPANFTLTSDVFDPLTDIRAGSDSAFNLFLSGISSGFTDAPTGPFTVGLFLFNYRASIPEPATWALMLGGFAVTGARLRRARAVAA